MAGPFQTPQNEKSFSAMIDQALLDTGRPAALLSAIQYGNATLRECHTLGLFYRDLIEDRIVSTTDTNFVWTQPSNFRRLRTARYGTSLEYPEFILPGRKQNAGNYITRQLYQYYAADDYFVFQGISLAEYLEVAYYTWPRKFQYYTRLQATNTSQLVGSNYSIRPAYYDENEGVWKYLNAASDGYVDTLGDTTEEERRRKLVYNWMLSGWYELILEGTKNKIFNLFSDTRAAGTFSLYKSMQKDLVAGSQFESEGV